MWLDACMLKCIHCSSTGHGFIFFCCFFVRLMHLNNSLETKVMIEKDEKNNDGEKNYGFSSGSFTHSKWIGFMCLPTDWCSSSMHNIFNRMWCEEKIYYNNAIRFVIIVQLFLLAKQKSLRLVMRTVLLNEFSIFQLLWRTSNTKTLNILGELWIIFLKTKKMSTPAIQRQNHLAYWLRKPNHQMPSHWLTHICHLRNEISTIQKKTWSKYNSLFYWERERKGDAGDVATGQRLNSECCDSVHPL